MCSKWNVHIHEGIMLDWVVVFIFFLHFWWELKDEDMVCQDVCPLVNFMCWTARLTIRFFFLLFFYAMWVSPENIRLKSGLWRSAAFDDMFGQAFWPTISPQWEPSASGIEGVNDCHLVCQQHGSSRKVTLKSSCGHSMVPTARAYAGLCQEIQASLSTELMNLNLSLERNWCFTFKLCCVMEACLWWKHAQSAELGQVSSIIWQIPSLSLAHAC